MGIGTFRELNSLKKEYEEDFEDLTRLARRRKRKCAADWNSVPNSLGNATMKRRNHSSQVKEQRVDMDYVQYLNHLDEDGGCDLDFIDTWLMKDGDVNVNSRSVSHGDDNVYVRSFGECGDDDDVDPQYKMFLENLREDGKSYVLEVVRENGNLQLIKYEQEDGILDWPSLYAPENLENSQVKETTGVKKTLTGGMKREQMNCLYSSAFLLNKEEIESPRTVRYAQRKNKRETLEDSEDPPKKKSSVVKNAKVGARDPVSGRKNWRSNKISGLEGPNTPETFENSPLKEKNDIEISPGRFMKEKKKKIDKHDSSARTLIKEETQNFRSLRYVLRDRDRVNLHNLEVLPDKKSSTTKKNVNQKVAGGKTTERRVKRPHLEVPHTKCRPVDDDYQRFLNGLEILGGRMVYTPIDGSPVIVVEDVESSSAQEIKVEQCDGKFASVAAVDVDSGRRIEIDDTSLTLFREGLMKDLKRPYDQKEYDKLWEEMSCHRQKEHDRNLRRVTKRCPVQGKFGESYQEHFKVLARKIDAASGSHPRILNLLRGFFYWLQNCAHEGCFCPWTDPSCLKVLPPLGKKRKFHHNCK